MKRFLTVFLSLMVAAGLLTGCSTSSPAVSGSSSGGGQAADTTITFWTHINADWNAAHDLMIAKFEAENPGIKVKRESFPYDEFESKTQTSLISKEGGADIYEIWGGWALDFASAGVFAPVPEEMVSSLVSDSYEPVLGALKYEEQYYGVPLEFNIEYGGLLVSKPKFADLGLEYPKTWEDMVTIGREHSSTEDTVVFEQRGLDLVAWDSLTYTWLSMILSSGENYLDDGKFRFNTPIGIETMQKLVDYVVVDKMTNLDGLTNSTEVEPYQRFFMGEALIVPRGPWVIPEGSSTYGLEYGKDFEYVSMPFYGPEKTFAAETGWSLAVNEASTKKDAAWKFLSFWMQPENMLAHDIACGMVPASKAVAHDPALLEAMPFMEPLIDILDGGRFIGYFNTDILKEAISNMYIDIVNNGTPVADAVQSLDDELNKE